VCERRHRLASDPRHAFDESRIRGDGKGVAQAAHATPDVIPDVIGQPPLELPERADGGQDPIDEIAGG
jgi:hypothetical protein